MGRPKKSDQFEIIRKRHKAAADYERENRKEARKDVKFRKGDHWPADVRKSREAEGRPCLTFNRLEGFVDQVLGDARQNKIDIKVTPVGDAPLAQIYEKIIDKIERESKATNAYQKALDHAAGNGFGWIRIVTEWEPGTFYQNCKIRRVTNPFTVYPQPKCVEQTKSDMMWCFVSVYMDKDEFEQKYKREVGEPTDYEGEDFENWYGDRVRVAEYFERKEIRRQMYLLDDGNIIYDKNEAMGREIVNQREDVDYEVYRSLICGDDYLEKPTKFPGRFIPLVFVPGKELDEDGKTHFRGVIRHARDAQVAYNFNRNAAAESVGVQPKAPMMATADQVEGFEAIWQTANTKNHSYLPYNWKPGQPIPQRIMPPQINAGAVNEAMMATEDLKATTGIFDASLGAKGNETSGKAIMARQREGDTATFAYHDNLAISLEQVGNVLISMIPEVYSGQRIIQLMNDNKEMQDVPLNQPTPDGGMVNDLKMGRYTAQVTTGPSYATKRIEARDTMMQLVQVAPEIRAKGLDKIFESFDFDGAQELADRFRPPPPDQPPPPDPEMLELQLKGEENEKEFALKERQFMADSQFRQKQLEQKDRELYLKEQELMIEAESKDVELQLKAMDKEIAMTKQESTGEGSQPYGMSFNVSDNIAESVSGTVSEAVSSAVTSAMEAMKDDTPKKKVARIIESDDGEMTAEITEVNA